jgi:hypothetical protein
VSVHFYGFRAFLGGLLPSRARFRFTGTAGRRGRQTAGRRRRIVPDLPFFSLPGGLIAWNIKTLDMNSLVLRRLEFLRHDGEILGQAWNSLGRT